MEISLFRNLIYNWAGLVLTVLVGFFLSPYIVHTLGPEQYGVWVVLVALSSQFIVFDFGLRHALIKFLAGSRSDKEEASKYISNAYFLLLFISVAGFLLFWLFTPVLFTFFDISAKYVGVARLTLLLLVLDAAIDLVMGTYYGALAGEERWDYINSVQVVRIVLYAVFAVVLLESGMGLLGIALATFVSRFIYRYILKELYRRVLPDRKLSFSLVENKYIKTLLTYGTWMFLMTVGLRVIYNIDTIVIGASLTAIDVTIYAVALIIVDYFRMLLQSTSSLLLPRLSALESAGKDTEISELVLTWGKLSSLLSVGIGLGIYMHSDDFMKLWMGQEFEFSAILLSILMLSYLITVPALACQQYLLAVAKHRLLAVLLLIEAVLNISLSLFLVRDYALIGVAIGTLLPATFLRGLVLPLLCCERLGFRFTRYCQESFLRPLPVVFLYWIILQYDFIVSETWGAFFIENGVAFGVYCLLYGFFIMNREERQYLYRRIGLVSQT